MTVVSFWYQLDDSRLYIHPRRSPNCYTQFDRWLIFFLSVSVTSAVGGIAVAKPSIISDTVPISIAILVVLFVGQSFGTAKLGFMFSPGTLAAILDSFPQPVDAKITVALVWFVILLATGIYNCTFYPGIFRAIDPSRAVMR